MIRRRAGVAASDVYSSTKRRGMRPAVGRARRIGGVRGEVKAKASATVIAAKACCDFMLSSVAGKGPSLQARMYTQSGRGSFAAPALGL